MTDQNLAPGTSLPASPRSAPISKTIDNENSNQITAIPTASPENQDRPRESEAKHENAKSDQNQHEKGKDNEIKKGIAPEQVEVNFMNLLKQIGTSQPVPFGHVTRNVRRTTFTGPSSFIGPNTAIFQSCSRSTGTTTLKDTKYDGLAQAFKCGWPREVDLYPCKI
jgi:hypothetical protein